MDINKYRVDSLKKKICAIMETNEIDSRILNKWYSFDFEKKMDELDEKLWNVWFEYLEKHNYKLGESFEVDDLIVEFVEYIDSKKVDKEWLFYAECSSLLIKYVEAKNILVA